MTFSFVKYVETAVWGFRRLVLLIQRAYESSSKKKFL